MNAGIILWWVCVFACLYSTYLLLFRTYFLDHMDENNQPVYRKFKFPIVLAIFLVLTSLVPILNIFVVSLHWGFIYAGHEQIKVNSVLFKEF
jgi:hypothetical protein